MAVLMEFSIFPMDKGNHLSGEVVKVIKYIKESGYPYQLTAMGTLIETPTLKEALLIVEHTADILAVDSERIYSTIKLDIKHGASNLLENKVQSIKDKL